MMFQGLPKADCEDVSKGDGETHKGDAADGENVPPATSFDYDYPSTLSLSIYIYIKIIHIFL